MSNSLLHKLWSRDVGRPGYDKKDRKALEAVLDGVIAQILRAVQPSAAEAPAPLPPEIMALVQLLPDEVLRLHEEAKRARLAFLHDPGPATEEACFAAEIAAGDCYRHAPYLAQEVKRLRAALEESEREAEERLAALPDRLRAAFHEELNQSPRLDGIFLTVKQAKGVEAALERALARILLGPEKPSQAGGRS